MYKSQIIPLIDLACPLMDLDSGTESYRAHAIHIQISTHLTNTHTTQ